MFGSPIEWCRVCLGWVAIDVSRVECAREHRCATSHCPVAHLFNEEGVGTHCARGVTTPVRVPDDRVES